MKPRGYLRLGVDFSMFGLGVFISNSPVILAISILIGPIGCHVSFYKEEKKA